jgi:hypothetical protein
MGFGQGMGNGAGKVIVGRYGENAVQKFKSLP